jgi:hypothetical protein
LAFVARAFRSLLERVRAAFGWALASALCMPTWREALRWLSMRESGTNCRSPICSARVPFLARTGPRCFGWALASALCMPTWRLALRWLSMRESGNKLPFPDLFCARSVSCSNGSALLWVERLPQPFARLRGAWRFVGFRSANRGTNCVPRFILVAEVGVEPTHPCGYWILSPARLPVPPFGQAEPRTIHTFRTRATPRLRRVFDLHRMRNDPRRRAPLEQIRDGLPTRLAIVERVLVRIHR